MGAPGPNLYGIIGRQAGTCTDFHYGPDLVAAVEAGLVEPVRAFQAMWRARVSLCVRIWVIIRPNRGCPTVCEAGGRTYWPILSVCQSPAQDDPANCVQKGQDCCCNGLRVLFMGQMP